MSSRWTGFFVWALVAASTAFWGFKIFAATRPVPDGAQAPLAAVPPSGPMERLFGAVVVPATPAEPQHPESDRFQLVGVIAPRGVDGRDGFAIVSIDGQPAKPWRVGATLDGATTLVAVAKRSADFGPAGGPAAFTKQLPEPAAAETGTLPAAVSQPAEMTQTPPAAARANAAHVEQPAFPTPTQRVGPGGRAGFQRGGRFGPGAAIPQQPGTAIPIEEPAQPQKADSQ